MLLLLWLWVAGLCCLASGNDADRDVWRDIHDATNGTHWLKCANNRDNPCDCELVVCGAQGQILSINLNANHLSSTLPGSMARLTHLESINIGVNGLTGLFPDLSAMTNLRDFYSAFTLFSGSLPSLATLTNLEYLEIGETKVSGNLHLHNHPKLTYLSASGTYLAGDLIVNAPNLEHLSVPNAEFSGTLPSSIALMTRLTSLTIHSNSFVGQFPSLPASLRSLSFAHNRLSGTLPDLCHLTSLRFMDGSCNQISGTLPACITNLKNLTFLDLSGNKLHGTLPNFSLLVSANAIQLRANNFEGTLPEIGSRSLSHLDVSYNRLHGPLPSFDDLHLLLTFAASHNRFTGPVPSLASCRFIFIINLENNRLTGTIPPLKDLQNLEGINFANNQLTGSVPELPVSLMNNGSFIILNNNFLSCELPRRPIGADLSNLHSIIAVGNAFSVSGSGSSWVSSRELDAHMLWADSRENGLIAIVVIGAVGGLVWLLILWRAKHLATLGRLFVQVANVWGCASIRTSASQPELAFEFAVKGIRTLFLGGVPAILLGILYAIYGSLYSCGFSPSRLSAAYLSGAPSVFGVIITLSVVLFGVFVALVSRLKSFVDRVYAHPIPEQVSCHRLSLGYCCRFALGHLVWACCITALNVPTLMFFLLHSIPSDNTWHISDAVAWILEITIAPGLLAVNLSVAPRLCWALVNATLPGASERTKQRNYLTYVSATRFFVLVLVPILVVVAMDESCLQGWKLLWKVCADHEDSFDIRHPYLINHVTSPFVVTTKEICTRKLRLDHRCPRRIVELSQLLHIRQLTLDAFVVPTIMLLRLRLASAPMFTRFHWASRFFGYTVDPDEFSLMCVVRMQVALTYAIVAPVVNMLAVCAIFTQYVTFICITQAVSGTNKVRILRSSVVPSIRGVMLALHMQGVLIFWTFADLSPWGMWILPIGFVVATASGILIVKWGESVWPSVQVRSNMHEMFMDRLLT
eukprot:c10970_g1_i2.p1 GENE.c10970_g1_i2~~c10970_g1_i2.p1  ORF type:complete len:987 (-),score=186.00 c10970_g1_i2:81-3011(-)